jgi:hypothetical protein
MVLFAISKFPFLFWNSFLAILNMASNNKQQKMIDCMFQRVDKEQKLMVVTYELDLLWKEIEMHNQEKEQMAYTLKSKFKWFRYQLIWA